jgi:glyoxylase-like metal-dependent hydrolase (beta-lactamase superfamily II)
VPIPERSLRVLSGGERQDGWEVAYTPGHASHHVSYLHRDSGWVFPGDTCGVRLPTGNLLLPPTPPPDIDLDAWSASLDQIEAWRPERVGITHFGDYGDVPEHLDRMRAALRHWSELARRVDRETYAAELRSAFADALDEQGALAFGQAMPPEDQWVGLDRYFQRVREAGATG